jgi:hypothetical protein
VTWFHIFLNGTHALPTHPALNAAAGSTVNWAEWAQVVAILITGLAAVFVANRQLGAYNRALESANRSERFRNSIKAVDELKASAEYQGLRMSPFEASQEIVQVSKTPNLDRFRRTLKELQNGSQPSHEDLQWFLDVRRKAAIVVGYYLNLSELLMHELIDRDYVMPKVAAMLPQTYDALNDLGDPYCEIFGLRWFVDDARRLQATIEALTPEFVKRNEGQGVTFGKSELRLPTK